jgi:Tfp pilus assembly protein PilN
MRAVNLIPSDSRKGPGSTTRSGGSVYVLLGVLAIAVVFVTVYVLTVNQISDQKAEVGALQAQASQAQASAARLAPYVEFSKLAQARADTIRQIASSRFDWQAALAGLSHVVPANTSLQSLAGAVPGASSGSTAASPATTALSGNTTGSSIALTGCSDSQVDVARLMSRLRLIDGVTQVSLQNSAKTGNAQSGAAVSASGGGGGGCPGGSPSFAMNIVFGTSASTGVAGVVGASPAGAQPISSAATTGATK